MKIGYFFEKLLKLLKAKVAIGGLEISDFALRFAYFDGERWQMANERLSPGIIEGGQIKNQSEFLRALKSLREQILGRRSSPKKKLNVVVSLSSMGVYSQTFSLPILEGEDLEKAIELNLQMASPSELSQDYAGWQIVGEDKSAGRLEILSAFANRSLVDDLYRALTGAGFLVAAVESHALSLTRLLREKAVDFDRDKSYGVIYFHGGGIDFLIVRHAHLYFKYAISWRDIQADNREISIPVLEEAVIRSFRQVLNFYNQHWQDQPSAVFIAATDLYEEIARTLTDNFSIEVKSVSLQIDVPIGSDWFVALGSGLRGTVEGVRRREIDLLGPAGQQEFAQQHLVAFLRFWRTLVPVSIFLLALIFLVGDLFLIRIRRSLDEEGTSLNLKQDELRSLEEFQFKVERFNNSVLAIERIKNQLESKWQLLGKMRDFASSDDISIQRFSFDGFGSVAKLSGSAKSEDDLKSFKINLEADKQFQKINLPLDAVKIVDTGLSFTIDFVASKEEKTD